MSQCNIGRILLAAWLAMAPLAAAPKGSALFKKGRAAELTRQYDEALDLYERALKEDPENQTYLMATRRLRFVAGQAHVDQGHRLLDQGKIEEAAGEFERAMAIDPASSIAEQEFRRTQELIRQRSKQKRAEKEEPQPGLSPVLAAKKQAEALFETALSLPKLKPISTQPINLKINNNSKIIFETIGKLAGINVLFDPDYQDRRFSLELGNATLIEALDYVGSLAKAFWKPLSSNAIFVTNDNTTKRRDYEEYVVKTFYLSNVYTAQELQEIATMVRSVTDLRRVFTVNSLNAMVIRGAADSVALAEKVIQDVDKARAEVIIDVLVLEASQSRTRELGIVPVSGSTPGINIPVAFTRGASSGSSSGSNGTGSTGGTGGIGGAVATAATGGSIALSDLGKIGTGDFSLALPGASIKALMSRSDTRVLQSPRVRGFDGVKTSLRIGDRIPIATGSFQPGIGGVGINPLVNTQFNYQDVGVVLDLQPKIHIGREVSMHVEIEISNVRDRIDIGGISQPVIGQRKIIHDIRLKEGESSIIGGLMQSQTTRSVSGIPGLAQIPLLGRLFSNERLEKSDNEILIVLQPHVVRIPELTELNLRGISTGTDQMVKLTFAPEKNDHPALPPVPPPAPVAPTPGPAPAGPPALAPAAPASPQQVPPPLTPATAPTPGPAPGGPPALAPTAPAPPQQVPPPVAPATAPTPGPVTGGPPALAPAAPASPQQVPPPVAPATAPTPGPAPGGPPALAPAAPASPQQVPPPVAPATAPTPGPAPGGPPPVTPAAPSAGRLRFDRPQVSEAAGGKIVLNLVVDGVNDLFAAPLRVTFDPKMLRLNDARRGGLLASDGQDIIFSKNVQNDTGEASINLSRFPGSGGVSGGGVLVTLEFEAAGPGKTSINISGVTARNARLETIPLGGAQSEVTIR